MFIIPIQDRISWQKPPVLVISLVLINIAVFAFWEQRDNTLYEPMATTYFESELTEREWPLFLDYLSEVDLQQWAKLADLPSDEAIYDYGIGYLWFDQGFDGYLQQYWLDYPDDDTGDWQAARQQFEQQRDQISSYRFGLIPADITPLTLFSHQFMHGSWGHVLGNMAFMMLFGFALERRLGALRLLGFYLVGGGCAGLGYALIQLHSNTPLVGASGAIAGLMGMYLAVYGVRTIEFFYSLGFYFGSFRAPALIVLPLWLGKEFVGAIAYDDNVAYMAHAAGLVAGVLVILAYKQLSRDEMAVADPEEAVDPGTSVPQKITELIEGLEFEKAWHSCRRHLQQHPHNQALWHVCLDSAARLSPQALNATLKEIHDLVASGSASDKLLRALCRHIEELHGAAEELSQLENAIARQRAVLSSG